MTVTDFLKKEYRLTKTEGVTAAVNEAAGEVTMKALNPVADKMSTPIWDTDFDVCLVLDACRYDLWNEVIGNGKGNVTSMADYVVEHPLSEHTDSKWSVGAASPEWLSKTFARKYDETVARTGYVTANPFSGKQGTEKAFLDAAVFPLQDRDFAHLDEVWRDAWPMSEEMPTVAPATVTERAMWAYENKDMERLVVHYMQPHTPFKKRPEWTAGWELDGFGTGGGKGKNDWHKVRDGEIPKDEFWNAYAANLEWVLHEVETWINKTDASILVTSDHGNAMGEYSQWGHPPGSANPAIRKVPWVEVEGVGTAPIDAANMTAPPTTDTESDIDEQLAALGYK